ncbi:MAG: hypothetical protein ABIH23_12640 [bacterium]
MYERRAPMNLVKGLKLRFSPEGTFESAAVLCGPFQAFGSNSAPISSATNVEIYPAQ